MTREEFQRWKHDGKEVWIIVKDKIAQLEYTNARQAGIDAGTDRFKAGMITGMEIILDIEWEDQEDVES